MQDHSTSFASLREMVQAADHIARFRQSSRKEGDSYWSGTSTFGEAKDLALRGWAEEVAKVRPLAEAIFCHVADKVFVRQPDFTYAGGAVNVGRFVAGHPKAFNTWTNEPQTTDGSKNLRALCCGMRVLSAYVLSSGERVWIITEADRSVTTILLPEEY